MARLSRRLYGENPFLIQYNIIKMKKVNLNSEKLKGIEFGISKTSEKAGDFLRRSTEVFE